MANKLQEFHKNTGIPQNFIADMAGITPRAYSRIVRGLTMPLLPSAIKIARAVGKSVEELWGDEVLVLKERVKKGEIEERSEKDDLLETGIESLNLSTRVYHILKRNQIHSYEDLINKDVTRRSGIGPKAQEELDAAIKQIKKELEELKYPLSIE